MSFIAKNKITGCYDRTGKSYNWICCSERGRERERSPVCLVVSVGTITSYLQISLCIHLIILCFLLVSRLTFRITR